MYDRQTFALNPVYTVPQGSYIVYASVCVCVCVYVYMCVCVYICVCVYVCVYVYVWGGYGCEDRRTAV